MSAKVVKPVEKRLSDIIHIFFDGDLNSLTKEKLNKLHLASIQFSKEFNSQISLQALALKFATFDKNISTTVTGMMETKEINSNIRSFQNNFSILKNLKKLKKIYNDFY